ncbi:OmpA family protein [Arthrobacter sp. NEB 688]|uniref:OmpA family protein n=1 Tax=Arthrobacter sp. NEB 688 TaxID=904039 RepID=UPI001564D208|nr:OmpA family protein [Arthrobacter sp. NEB 688]QKE85401.1 OmpA family protein [Arthrobacter sp. NEB 688]
MKTLATVLATAAALTCAVPAVAATAPPLPSVPDVPVLGQAWIGNVTDQRLAVLSVHGLRRVEGATVLYYSLGLRSEDQTGDEAAFFSAYGNGNNFVLTQNGSTGLECTAAAIDVAGSVAYSALKTDEVGRCISTKNLDLEAPRDQLGRATVGWVLLAPVPQTVTTVDVLVGSSLVQGVPVEDGLLEPTVTESAPAVGTGWPTVDTSRVSEAVDPDGAVFDLRSQVQDVKKKVTQAKRDGRDELELDASVLFDTDKATLTRAASGVIAEAAKQITAAGSTGTITVVGHTDSNAGDAYNLDLSKRRAAAVAKALAPRIPKGIRITPVGKGETEPIADNGSAEGRALNRRVTITLPK